MKLRMCIAGAVLVACSTAQTTTTVSANGQTGVIPCPGTGCVGGFLFVCDADGMSSPSGACTDAGPRDAGHD